MPIKPSKAVEEFLENEDNQLLVENLIEQLREGFIVCKIREGLTRDEITEIIKSDGFDLESLTPNFLVTLDSLWTPHIETSLQDKEYELCCVLVGVQIEQIINSFFNSLLSEKFLFPINEISTILNSVNLPAKLGWFLTITTGKFLSDDLKKDLLRIVTLRNKIAHYKPIKIDDQVVKPEDLILLEKSPYIIQSLEEALEQIWVEMYPEYKIAKEVTKEFRLHSNK